MMQGLEEKILIVVNPVSGGMDKQPILETIKSRLTKHKVLDVLKTTGNNDKKAVNLAIQRIKPHRIIVIGGDGTLKLITEAEKPDNTVIGIIPAGSANGLATNLNLPNSIKTSVEVALGDHIVDIDNLCIGRHLCLHLSDMGLNADLINRYCNLSIRGYLGYAISAIPALSNVKNTYHFIIQTPDRIKEEDAIMVAFANCKKFGTGVIINPDAMVGDGKFEILIFKNFNALNVIRTLNGNIPMVPEFVEVIQTTEAIVTTDRPVPFQIDGEAYNETTEVSVTILSANMKVAVP